MSTRIETASGLIWNVQKEHLPLGPGVKQKLLHVRIRRVSDGGRFIEEIRAKYPDVKALSLELDEYDDCTHATADLSGLEKLSNLKVLIANPQGKIFTSTPINASLLGIQRLLVGYFPGVSEAMVSAPKLTELTIEDAPLDALLGVRADLNELTLFRPRKSSCPKAWNKVSRLERLNIDQAGTLYIDAPEDGWPPEVSIRWASSVKGLIQASQVQPFNHLHLNGTRLLDVGTSLWDLKARSVFIEFANRPPQWLVKAWPDRPDDWAQRFIISHHPSLPGSEETVFEDCPEQIG